MKITIDNQTVWPTSMLRPYIVRAAREEFDGSTKKRDPKLRRDRRVTITYTRGGHSGCSGSAYVGGRDLTVSVPNPNSVFDPEIDGRGRWGDVGGWRKRRKGEPAKAFPVHDFVHILIHEFGHNVGLHHAQMGGRYQNRDRAFIERTFPWVLTLPVPVLREKKAKPTTDAKRAAELTAAKAAVQRWERKTKLAQTKVKLWTRRVRVLTRRMETHGQLHARADVGTGGPGDPGPAEQVACTG